MLSTAKLNPAVFFATCARLIPADVKLTVQQTYGGLVPEDYATHPAGDQRKITSGEF
jgi:hypothetical protein